MGHAYFLIAIQEMLGRLPTPEEKLTFLKSMARQCGGERVYVANRVMTADEAEPEIARLRAEGWSVRRIASAVGWSKSRVAEVVQYLALKVDSEAA